MFAVLSATENDFYALPLPFAVYSWYKLGFYSIIFLPTGNNPKLSLAKAYCKNSIFYEFECEDRRIPTYSQVIRNFGAALSMSWQFPNNVMITSDSDMVVFSSFFKGLDDGRIHVVGHDLTPPDQYPMCFCGMPIMQWHEVMKIGTKTYQQCVSELIDPIDGLDIRGEQWCYDQWYLKRMLKPFEKEIVFHNRSDGQNQLAKNRADRDGWQFDPYSIIDAHLPRPLTDRNNFTKVIDLFTSQYPQDDLSWMHTFYNEYIKIV